ncbi:uncharacterized protein LOC128546406 [Mercenaria mercenaria]|uniref:uncharacterized protein LOC128546406 n=1 Tax=Mercenaria mercenaria TaxID=6596 RepID=UPI00234F9B44|nr:uncharacterized protein LOC128546406 [Mercenaria mercenaria]
MFLFAFNAFAQCSEITLSKPGTKSFILKLADVELTYKEKKPTTVTVTFRYVKHNYGKPHVLSFSHGHTNISPPVAMHDYLTLRGRHDGLLFALTSGLPVPRKMFEKKLASTLNFCELDGKKYKSHSFSIGKATDCAQRGYSDANIRSLGRWNSNAFQKCIRNSE